jgi:hypothetical protein
MTRKVAVGTGAVQAQGESRESGGMTSAMSKGSASFSKPTALGLGIDMSVSLARRSNEFGSPRSGTWNEVPGQAGPPEPRPNPPSVASKPPGSQASVKTIIIVAVVVIAVAITMFMLVGPQ